MSSNPSGYEPRPLPDSTPPRPAPPRPAAPPRPSSPPQSEPDPPYAEIPPNHPPAGNPWPAAEGEGFDAIGWFKALGQGAQIYLGSCAVALLACFLPWSRWIFAFLIPSGGVILLFAVGGGALVVLRSRTSQVNNRRNYVLGAIAVAALAFLITLSTVGSLGRLAAIGAIVALLATIGMGVGAYFMAREEKIF